MVMRLEVEEGTEMNQELRDAFDNLRQDIKSDNQETRKHISEFGAKLNAHMIEDALTAERLKAHLDQEEKSKKFKIALIITTIGATLTAVGEVIVHHFSK